MGIARIVNTDFWIDEKVIDYYSPEDKYFWLYILTNPQTRQLGVYKLPKKIMSFQLGYSMETVQVLLDRFQNEYKVIQYSDKTQEIAILNYLKYSIVKGGKPVIDCIKQDIEKVNNKALLKMVYDRISLFNDKKETIKAIKDLLSIYDNDNDNDNDNDSVVPRHDTRNVPRYDKEQKPTRHKYGLYENVLLTDDDFKKLRIEFPIDWESRIERLSEYIASTGKTYKNHLATIRSWARKDSQSGNPFKEALRKEIANEQNRSNNNNDGYQGGLSKLLQEPKRG